MICVNNDFFDDFSVVFQKDACVLNDCWYPLGSFAAEMLQLDETPWRQAIRSRLAIFKEEFAIFLSSRSASAAALSQQALNTLWEQIGTLPVYRQLFSSCRSWERLFSYLQEHPQVVDDIVTEGTQHHQAVGLWLEKLDNLTDSLSGFCRNTRWMLENYFEDLHSRKPEAYAEAYVRYCREAMMDLEISADEGVSSQAEAFVFDFPVRLSFVPLVSPRTGKVFLGEKMIFTHLASFLYTDLCKGMAAGNLPRRCQNCGKWFLAQGGYSTVYCERVAPGETKKTCRQVGAHRTERKKKSSSPIQVEYSRTYNRLKARKRSGTLSVEEWNRKVAQAQQLKEKALAGGIDLATLQRSLRQL